MDVHVVMASDAGYLMPLTVTLHGMCENGSPANTYVVHLITPAELDLAASPLVAAVCARHANLRLEQVRVPASLHERFCRIVEGTYLAPSSCYRLAIGELLPELDRCVYLDCDVSVQGDIAEFYCEELGDASVGAVRDPVCGLNGPFAHNHQQILGFSYDMRYFCAGIMLMDLARMRERGHLERMANARMEGTLFGDQDVLNTLLRGDVRLLPLRYDVLVKEWTSRAPHFLASYPADEVAQVDAGGAVVLHYAGPEDKPWAYLQLRSSEPWLRQAQDILPADELAGVWDRWRARWEELSEEHLLERCAAARRVFVHGFTRHGRACVDLLAAHGIAVEAFTDNNSAHVGLSHAGIVCLQPADAQMAQEGTLVVVASQVNHAQVIHSLASLGVERANVVRFFNHQDAFYRSQLRPAFAQLPWPQGEVPV